MELEQSPGDSEEDRLVARVAPAGPSPIFFPYESRGATIVLLCHEVVRRAEKFPGKLIPLCMGSPGGSFFPAIFFWELVKDMGIRLDITAYGRVYSSALIILCAGERRRASSTTRFLLHPVFLKLPPAVTRGDLQREDDFAEADEDQLAKIVGSVTGQPVARIIELMHQRTHLDAEGAKALGIIQEVRQIVARQP